MKRPEFKTGNASFREALNLVLDYAQQHGLHPGGRPGWIETKDGWFPPFISPSQSGGRVPWELEITDSAAGVVKVKCGTIIKSPVDITTTLTIGASTDSFTVVAGNNIRLKITGPFVTPVCTLEKGGEWTDHPAMYETTGSAGSAEFAAYYFPLWEFVATAGTDNDTILIKEGLHARKIAPNNDFLRTATGYHKPGDRPYGGHFLLPYHRALTAT